MRRTLNVLAAGLMLVWVGCGSTSDQVGSAAGGDVAGTRYPVFVFRNELSQLKGIGEWIAELSVPSAGLVCNVMWEKRRGEHGGVFARSGASPCNAKPPSRVFSAASRARCAAGLAVRRAPLLPSTWVGVGDVGA